MPKLKTKAGAKKRFKRTGSGQYVHKASNRRHILTKKAKKRKVHLRGNHLIKKCDQKSIARMLTDQ